MQNALYKELPSEEGIVKGILDESKRAATNYQSNLLEEFERNENPQVEYDFDVHDVPLLNSLTTLISVTTFLSGFIANDFSNFTMDDWHERHWAWPLIYISLLSFAEISCLYLSICGSMVGVAYQRSLNQNKSTGGASWQDLAQAAVEPVTANLASLKGKRMDTYSAALTSLVSCYKNYQHTYIYAGVANVESIFVKARLRRITGPNSEQTWVIGCKDPACTIGEAGFKYVRSPIFLTAMGFYIVAQTLEALNGSSRDIVVVVSLIIFLGCLKILADFWPLYKKIND